MVRLPLAGHSNRDGSRKDETDWAKSRTARMCAMILMALVSSFLGVAAIHAFSPLTYSAPRFWILFLSLCFFFLFPFLHTTLCTLSCLATCVSGTIWSTFSPLQTWSCDTIVSVAERSQTYSPSTVLTLFRKKKKIAMVVTYVFQTSGLKAKIYSVSSHVF